MEKATLAAELFVQGYNCAQAIAVAFCDEMGIDQVQVAKMVSGFGGGMGRLREVCGAVSGMVFVASTLYGYDMPDEDKAKKEHYERVQALAGDFREQIGSIVCREILKNPPSDPTPSPRTEEYYRDRPCVRIVYRAAQVLDDYIRANPVTQEK